MAKRKRLTPASITGADTGAESASEAPLETKASYPLGVAPPARTRAPIAQVAGEASAQAALTEVAEELQTARDTGRLVQMLSLDAVKVDHLHRDRMVSDAEEMAALKASIAARGQQTAIEVVELGEGQFGLISGWRRLQALSALYGETGEARFAKVQALIKPIETVSDSYVAMVEENEIRADLSYYERARLACEAAKIGIYPNPERAVQVLFANTTPAKRSKIKAFTRIHLELGRTLHFAAAIPERLGLELVRKMEGAPKFADQIRESLRSKRPADAAAERKALEILLKGSKAVKAAAQAKAAPQEVLPGVALESRKNRLTLRGAGVTPELKEALLSWLRTQSG
ncbi:MAG: ParB N-terminal domain-containing protein [Pseudomonadota bacterium]